MSQTPALGSGDDVILLRFIEAANAPFAAEDVKEVLDSRSSEPENDQMSFAFDLRLRDGRIVLVTGTYSGTHDAVLKAGYGIA